jgi:hypothetical protein
MSQEFCHFRRKPVVVSIGLCVWLIGAAQAQVSATASYSLGGGSVVSLADPASGSAATGVDVLAFPSDANGYTAGIHTYGGLDGNFGSRSSGYGYYDVTGLFSITQSITNSTAVAQRARFNFYITPGLLQNDVRSDLSTSGNYVAAGIKFDITRNGASVWNSGASLRTDASGTAYSQTGTNIYTQTDARTYDIGGGHYEADLGVINAGESITLQYKLSTLANGHAPGGGAFTIPAQTFTVPEQTIYHPAQTYTQWVYDGGEYGGYGYGGYGGGHLETVTLPASTEVIPEHTVTSASYVAYGEHSGSHASSGDPFDVSWYGQVAPVTDVTGNLVKPLANPFSVTMTAVPEPQAYAMAIGGLAVVGALARRRRRQTV